MGKKRRKYEVRIPLTLKGGIRAQFTGTGVQGMRTKGGRVWWSRRWTDVLERFRIGARLGRGRNYAVSGQVANMRIEPGLAQASVQGTSGDPYGCFIRFRLAEGEKKTALLCGLRERPMLIARLLVGELPYEVEELFTGIHFPLFPSRENDIWSQCSCPDHANPCKHLAAVYYLLGEAITRNPLLLLALRGISRNDLLAGSSSVAEPPVPETIPPTEEEREPLSPAAFYGGDLPPLSGKEDAAPVSEDVAPLIARLGSVPFWRGQERFTETLERLYARAAARGMIAWAAEPLDLRREEEKVIITGSSLRAAPRRFRADSSWL